MHNNIKNKAKKLKETLYNDCSLEISHTVALNIMAKVEDYKSYTDYIKRNEKLKIIEDNYRENVKKYNTELFEKFSKLNKKNNFSIEHDEYFDTYILLADELLKYFLVLNDIKISVDYEVFPFIEIKESTLYCYMSDNSIGLDIIKINPLEKHKFEFSIFNYEKDLMKFKKIDVFIDEILKYYGVYKFDINVYENLFIPFRQKNNTNFEIENNYEKISLFGKEFFVGNSITFKNLDNNKFAKVFYTYLGNHTQNIIDNIKFNAVEDSSVSITINGIEFGIEDETFNYLFDEINVVHNLLNIGLFDDDSYNNYTFEKALLEQQTDYKTLEEYFFDLFCDNDYFLQDELTTKIISKYFDLDDFNDLDFDDLEKEKLIFQELITKISNYEFILLFCNTYTSNIISLEKLHQIIKTNKEFVGTQRYYDLIDSLEEHYESYYDSVKFNENYYELHDLVITNVIQIATNDNFPQLTQKDYSGIDCNYLLYLKLTSSFIFKTNI